MQRNQQGCNIGRRVLGLVVLLGIITVGAFAVPTSAWAVDGGYGPGGGWSEGGGGTLGNVIVAQTVGPGGAKISGSDGAAKITIFIPPGAFPNEELVKVTASVPDCKGISGRDVVIAFVVTYSMDGKNQSAFSGDLKIIVSDHRISSHSSVLTDCAPLKGVDINDGYAAAPIQFDATIAIVSASRGNSQPHDSGVGHHWWIGLFRPAI